MCAAYESEPKKDRKEGGCEPNVVTEVCSFFCIVYAMDQKMYYTFESDRMTEGRSGSVLSVTIHCENDRHQIFRVALEEYRDHEKSLEGTIEGLEKDVVTLDRTAHLLALDYGIGYSMDIRVRDGLGSVIIAERCSEVSLDPRTTGSMELNIPFPMIDKRSLIRALKKIVNAQDSGGSH